MPGVTARLLEAVHVDEAPASPPPRTRRRADSSNRKSHCTKNHRYPYEFRVSDATPSGYEAGYQKPAATGGGHRHPDGGGWVDNRADVASTVRVGPRAAVFGDSAVTGNARVGGLARVDSGATMGGNVVVKDDAIVQGGANLPGSPVPGGDAESGSAVRRART